MKKRLVVEPSTTPMNGSMVCLKNVSPKYHRVWQTQADMSFLLTKGTRQQGELSQGGMCARREGHADISRGKRMVHQALQWRNGREKKPEQKVASLMLRKHLINLAKAVTEKGSLRIWRKLCSDIMVFHRGGQSDKSECL
jgi:hypothetical protein